ncbi:MAG: CocE/NonD family hydrolase [Aeromicrobium sp.]
MSRKRGTSRLIAIVSIALSMIGASFQFQTASAATEWTPRAEQYSTTAKQTDLAIPMSDGTILRGDLTLPADAAGNSIAGRFPVVVTITAYNKSVIGSAGSDLAGADPAYLVKRGYAQLTVDARGTGNSEGVWGAFSAAESRDAGEVVDWAHSSSRPWSSGEIGMTGASYMGISQIFAASHQPAGLKAIFPQVPGADVYRDVVASGGQLDVGFIPLWLGLVTATGLIPPAYAATEPQSAFKSVTDHITGLATFTLPLLLKAIAGADSSYDGPFYAERSPINVIDKVKIPTFLIGGEHDLFQRGTPMLFENLRKRGVPTKLIVGPWDHLPGSSGTDVDQAGYGELAELQLRWFDKYLKGAKDTELDSDISPLTYYEQGTGKWRKADDWIGPNLEATSYKLSGRSLTGGAGGTLTTGPVADGTSDVLPVPVAGLCTRSANQWTAGILNTSPVKSPCQEDNALNDRTGIVFDTAPVTSPVAMQGPINAHLFTSSVGGDGMLSVAVSDVAPDGKVSRLTGGWQVLSLRKLTAAKSRYLDGKLIQPFHPFTKASEKPLAPSEVAPIDVEVFPTGAQIQKGHKLRISIQAFDVPHLLPTVPQLAGTLTVMKVHNSAKYPSELTIPTLR